MKKAFWAVLVLFAFSLTGCAQKSETEKLGDQFEKAGKEMQKDAEKTSKKIQKELNGL